VRLLGALLAWHAGFGLTGVVASIAVSIVAGWVPLRFLLRRTANGPAEWTHVGRSIALAAIPFALLQASQVVLLDGDVILAKLALSADEAGYVAALSLFQRIQFFACFGLASVLLPAVSGAVSRGRSAVRPAAAVAGLFGCVSALVIGGSLLVPGQIITIFVGPSFLPAQSVLSVAAASSVAFTLSYLLATYLSAIGDRGGIWLIAAACPVQLAVMSAGAESLSAMLEFKLVCQVVLAALLVARATWRTLCRSRPVSTPIPI